jgi:segregation and condensation protein B
MSESSVRETEASALEAAVEAVLFAAGEPVHPREIAAAFEGTGEAEVLEAIEALRRRHERGPSGLVVEQVAGAFRLATKPDVGAVVRQFFRQRNRTRLSPAALESLAIIAYRQPVTAPEIQAIRGVDPSGPLKSLLEKKMVRILGRKKVVGNPLLYGTTKQFLVHFGLNRLEDLPSIEEFDQFLGAIEGGGETLAAVELDPPVAAEAEE